MNEGRRPKRSGSRNGRKEKSQISLAFLLTLLGAYFDFAVAEGAAVLASLVMP